MRSNQSNQTLCVICFEESSIFGKYDCCHTICYRCATKMAFLHKNFQCSQCNRLSSYINFCSLTHESCNENKNTESIDNQISILYQNKHCKIEVRKLLEIKCRECIKNNIHDTFQSLNDLYIHFRTHKNKYICKVCIDRNYELWDEIQIYTTYEKYEQHQRETHVYCIFCNKMYFDIKDIKMHCINMHQICSICTTLGKNHIYLENYAQLIEHYKAEHYCCHYKACVSNHCFAYAHKSELWAHYCRVHNIQKSYDDITFQSDLKICKIDLMNDFAITDPARDGTHTDITKKLFKNLNTKAQILNPTILLNKQYVNSNYAMKQNKMVANRIKSILEMQSKLVKNFTYNAQIENDIYTMIIKYMQDDKSTSLTLLSNSLEDVLFNAAPSISFTNKKRIVYELLNISLVKTNQVIAFLSNYLKSIKYPQFQKTEIKTQESGIIRKNKFKVIDLSKFNKS